MILNSLLLIKLLVSANVIGVKYFNHSSLSLNFVNISIKLVSAVIFSILRC